MLPNRKVSEIATGRWPAILMHFGIEERFLKTSTANALFAAARIVIDLTTSRGADHGFATSAAQVTGSHCLKSSKDGRSRKPRSKSNR